MNFTVRQMARLCGFLLANKFQGGPFRFRELLELFPGMKRPDLALQVGIACDELGIKLSTSSDANIEPIKAEDYVIDAWSSDLVWVFDQTAES